MRMLARLMMTVMVVSLSSEEENGRSWKALLGVNVFHDTLV
jgi:hypothetical protein